MNTRRQSLQGFASEHAQHSGLWLDKFLAQTVSKTVQSDTILVGEATGIKPLGYKTFYDRWLASLQEMGAILYEATTLGRLSIGLGSASVIETAVSIHRIYGVPYIPGSALKGVTAHYAHQYQPDVWSKNGEAHKTLFGTTESAGYVTFLDALPLPSKWQLHQDTITVHHPEYYQGLDKAPADWDSPTPIPFLSVSGTFLIALYAPDAPKWDEQGLVILRRALADIGVGAKTSSGYGRFDSDIKKEAKEGSTNEASTEVKRLRQQIENLKQPKVPTESHNLYLAWKEIKPRNCELAKAILEKIKTHKKYYEKKVANEWIQDLIACAE